MWRQAVYGELVAVDSKVALLPIPLGTADFLVHHIHAFTIHVTVLILLKDVLFAHSSRLIPDKAILGFRFPCDGLGRGGTFGKCSRMFGLLVHAVSINIHSFCLPSLVIHAELRRKQSAIGIYSHVLSFSKQKASGAVCYSDAVGELCADEFSACLCSQAAAGDVDGDEEGLHLPSPAEGPGPPSGIWLHRWSSKQWRGLSSNQALDRHLECGVKLSKHDDEEKVIPTFFKSLVGSLRYLTCTRPDILYAVGLVSRYMEDPTTTHLKIAKRILRYIKVLFPTHPPPPCSGHLRSKPKSTISNGKGLGQVVAVVAARPVKGEERLYWRVEHGGLLLQSLPQGPVPICLSLGRFASPDLSTRPVCLSPDLSIRPVCLSLGRSASPDMPICPPDTKLLGLPLTRPVCPLGQPFCPVDLSDLLRPLVLFGRSTRSVNTVQTVFIT
ncbi:hypothetical protein ZIOFF_030731 [Zingiber officinale]|uniref:Mitochondrial protein n=1 Tax=Zingiber officinale TaxID=94328 RepID=A0A8J5LBY0_ZINOF|nr:hypothetical protein ZIOFF_030731 [Zingiber officinale]